jgi:hypothetical protein
VCTRAEQRTRGGEAWRKLRGGGSCAAGGCCGGVGAAIRLSQPRGPRGEPARCTSAPRSAPPSVAPRPFAVTRVAFVCLASCCCSLLSSHRSGHWDGGPFGRWAWCEELGHRLLVARGLAPRGHSPTTEDSWTTLLSLWTTSGQRSSVPRDAQCGGHTSAPPVRVCMASDAGDASGNCGSGDGGREARAGLPPRHAPTHVDGGDGHGENGGRPAGHAAERDGQDTGTTRCHREPGAG